MDLTNLERLSLDSSNVPNGSLHDNYLESYNRDRPVCTTRTLLMYAFSMSESECQCYKCNHEFLFRVDFEIPVEKQTFHFE